MIIELECSKSEIFSINFGPYTLRQVSAAAMNQSRSWWPMF